jgi:hypothetical protein
MLVFLLRIFYQTICFITNLIIPNKIKQTYYNFINKQQDDLGVKKTKQHGYEIEEYKVTTEDG